jgi:hypothetical protein
MHAKSALLDSKYESIPKPLAGQPFFITHFGEFPQASTKTRCIPFRNPRALIVGEIHPKIYPWRPAPYLRRVTLYSVLVGSVQIGTPCSSQSVSLRPGFGCLRGLHTNSSRRKIAANKKTTNGTANRNESALDCTADIKNPSSPVSKPENRFRKLSSTHNQLIGRNS